MKNLKVKILTGALAFSLIIPTVSFATTSDNDNECTWQKGIHQTFKQKNIRFQVDEETKEQVQEIMQQVKDGELTQEEAKAKMEELGLEGFRGNMPNRPELDEETKEQVQEIMQQVKDGELTQEEAKAKLEELGLEGFRGNMPNRPEVDEETKEQAQEIMQQVKDGELTQEEAKADGGIGS